jgi:hypothetical protein
MRAETKARSSSNRASREEEPERVGGTWSFRAMGQKIVLQQDIETEEAEGVTPCLHG